METVFKNIFLRKKKVTKSMETKKIRKKFGKSMVSKVFFSCSASEALIFFASLYGLIFSEIISNYNQRGVLKLKNQEKSSEMNVSERDLIPVKISAPNSKY